MKRPKKVILLILDGWGIGKKDRFNAIDNAATPHFDELKEKYPYKLLKADGESVGLPKGQMGTSEVNHQVIGTGKIEKMILVKIDEAIERDELKNNDEINKVINHIEKNNGKLHLMGILSDGGVHYQNRHLFSILEILKRKNFKNPVYFHLFTDGRDAPPISAEKYLKDLDEKIAEYGIGKIATIQGRFYLDRDREWSKTDIAVNLIVNGQGKKVNSWQEVLEDAYVNNEVYNDQYVSQYVLDKDGLPKEGDAMICWAYRVDRLFQILKRILDQNIPNFRLTSFVNPSADFDFTPIFPEETFKNTLADIISQAGRTQYRLTETEKYTHLTYFFNGHREQQLPGETWKLFESNRYVKPEYNFEPSMRTYQLTKEIIQNIEEDKYDFQVVNFPQTDMVGHTGNYNAAVIAAESADFCVGKIYEALKDKLDDYALIVTADHGNSDEMWDYEANQAHTRHTLNPVPFIVVINGDFVYREFEGCDLLSNIAPTILDLMNLEKPEEMTGESLIEGK